MNPLCKFSFFHYIGDTKQCRICKMKFDSFIMPTYLVYISSKLPMLNNRGKFWMWCDALVSSWGLEGWLGALGGFWG